MKTREDILQNIIAETLNRFKGPANENVFKFEAIAAIFFRKAARVYPEIKNQFIESIDSINTNKQHGYKIFNQMLVLIRKDLSQGRHPNFADEVKKFANEVNSEERKFEEKLKILKSENPKQYIANKIEALNSLEKTKNALEEKIEKLLKKSQDTLDALSNAERQTTQVKKVVSDLRGFLAKQMDELQTLKTQIEEQQTSVNISKIAYKEMLESKQLIAPTLNSTAQNLGSNSLHSTTPQSSLKR